MTDRDLRKLDAAQAKTYYDKLYRDCLIAFQHHREEQAAMAAAMSGELERAMDKLEPDVLDAGKERYGRRQE